VLYPSPLADNGEVLSLNVAVGCAQRGASCSPWAEASYPGDKVVYLFSDTAERLAAELAAGRKRPRAVYVSPATDPFPPLAAVQAETARVVEVLAAHGVEAWLMTRGTIRPAIRRALAAHRHSIKLTVGLTTLDRPLQRLLEPLAASPRMRLRQIARLRQLGFAVQVALEPLVPGLTDTRANLWAVLEALAGVGVRQVTTGYLCLRAGLRDTPVQAVGAGDWEEAVLDAFADGPVLKGDHLAPARYLPKARRQRGYAALMALAAGLGIQVCVNRITNPDFRAPRQPGSNAGPRPRLLPLFEAATAGANER
jgi:hypothetical protein